MQSYSLTSSRVECVSDCRDSILTIVIPTYNRLVNLENLCEYLSRNIGPKTKVLVIDNCSNFKLEDQSFVKNLSESRFSFFKNKYHLGPDANVLRAIEFADTPWIYLLGDSKLPSADVLKEMEFDCRAHSEALGIVYRFRSSGMLNRSIQTVDELRSSEIDLGDFFLGGSSLISRKAIIKYFSIASMYTLSRMPHSLFHILALANNEKIFLSSKKIIEQFVPKPVHYSPNLSLLECWAQFSLILALPLQISDLRVLNNKILNMENATSRLIFLKFGLIQIFRKRVDIRPYTTRIISYRYSFIFFSFEKVLVNFLHLIAIIFTPIFMRIK